MDKKSIVPLRKQIDKTISGAVSLSVKYKDFLDPKTHEALLTVIKRLKKEAVGLQAESARHIREHSQPTGLSKKQIVAASRM